jgi:hypothetical protein
VPAPTNKRNPKTENSPLFLFNFERNDNLPTITQCTVTSTYEIAAMISVKEPALTFRVFASALLSLPKSVTPIVELGLQVVALYSVRPLKGPHLIHSA